MSCPQPKEPRVVISGRVSQESADGWRSFCEGNGISLAAFLEAAGRVLGNETVPPSVEERRRMVEAARKVDLDRRRRRHSV